MRTLALFAVAALFASAPAAPAQPEKKKNEDDFAREKHAVGDKLPDVTVYTPDGKEVKTAELRGHYTVLTFGCLT